MIENLPFQIEKIKESRLSTIDFEQLEFGKIFSDHMFLAEFKEGHWASAKILPYQELSYAPAAAVFHYGQAIFEGLKANKTAEGEIILFRPEENWKRMNRSAQRMCMPEVPKEFFIEGIKELVSLDKNWIPYGEGKSLYIRPFLIASDSFLGVRASDSYQFIVITSPTSTYYRGAVSVKIETDFSRAASGGIGAAKAAANYAASLFPAQKAKAEGFDQLIWTDSSEHKYIEESGTMNLMMISGGKLLTPTLDSNTILPGITRDSILTLARKWNMEVEERKIAVDELINSLKDGSISEIFGVGTAATIAPIKSIGYEGEVFELADYENWEFANKVKNYLKELKEGALSDEFGWTVKA